MMISIKLNSNVKDSLNQYLSLLADLDGHGYAQMLDRRKRTEDYALST